jgi:hypothetical protein
MKSHLMHLSDILFFLCIIQVFMKENSRGLYSCLLYWLFGSIPYLFYRSILGILYACISAALLNLDDGTHNQMM